MRLRLIPAIKKVRVAVGEARQNQSSTGVDHFCFGIAVMGDVLRATDRDDLFTADCNRFRPWLLGVHRVGMRVKNHNVGSGFFAQAIGA